MDYLIKLIIVFLARIAGLMPFGMLYKLSDFTAFMLFHVFRYRRKVIENNMRRSFPEMSEAARKKLVKKSYQNLADISWEAVKGFTMSDEEFLKRYKVTNLEILEPYRKNKRSAVFMPAHYANWEWGTKATPLQLGYKNVVIIYKPFANRYAESFFKEHRAHHGLILGTIYETMKLFRKYAPKFSAFIMVTDQSPAPVAKKVYRIPFLGRETAFMRGAELFARQYNLPVFFSDCQRVKRGYYQLSLSLITENPASLPEGEVTARYARKLEEVITKKPEDWLWSHRRWKKCLSVSS
jgi:KDO2-lipid IV(A) lauroyltransferase